MSGPLDKETLPLLREAVERLEQGFRDLPPWDAPPADPAALRRVLLETATRLQDNYPYFHPAYAGQMLKPPHAIARLAYSLALYINPNNHALDGSRASSPMEKEAVAEIARMFGWDTHLGHLAGGGTMANLEALWVAGQLRPGETIVASGQAHYTHARISGVLKLPFEAIACDASAGAGPNMRSTAKAKVVDVVTSCFSLRNVTVTGNSSPSTMSAVRIA